MSFIEQGPLNLIQKQKYNGLICFSISENRWSWKTLIQVIIFHLAMLHI